MQLHPCGAGARRDLKTHSGLTPLSLATLYGYELIVEMLSSDSQQTDPNQKSVELTRASSGRKVMECQRLIRSASGVILGLMAKLRNFRFVAQGLTAHQQLQVVASGMVERVGGRVKRAAIACPLRAHMKKRFAVLPL